jgi:hypothetical protein
VLLVISYSQAARQTLRNVCRAHEDAVVGQFGRVALREATEFGAFQALRLREKHGTEIQVEWTQPFNEFTRVPQRVREAATAYERRDQTATPYERFATGRELPLPGEMRDEKL